MLRPMLLEQAEWQLTVNMEAKPGQPHPRLILLPKVRSFCWGAQTELYHPGSTMSSAVYHASAVWLVFSTGAGHARSAVAGGEGRRASPRVHSEALRTRLGSFEISVPE